METRLVDILAAYYASKGEVECVSLNSKLFNEVLTILTEVPKLYPDLVQTSAMLRINAGQICHMDCHVRRMLAREKGAPYDYSC